MYYTTFYKLIQEHFASSHPNHAVGVYIINAKHCISSTRSKERFEAAVFPLASRVVRYRLRLLGSARSRFGSFASQKRYSIVFACSPTGCTSGGMPLPETGARVQITTSQTKKHDRPNGLSCFLAEKERFELSRRLIPTYTLSRGASSANLSTSPYGKPPFFKLAKLLYPISSHLSISFLRFLGSFFLIFHLFLAFCGIRAIY